MSRMIDADELAQTFWKVLYEYEDKTEKQFMEHVELDLSDWFCHRIFVQTIHGHLLNALEDAPSIDLVRCEECIHYCYDDRYKCYECYHEYGLGEEVKPNYFCSYGERRE